MVAKLITPMPKRMKKVISGIGNLLCQYPTAVLCNGKAKSPFHMHRVAITRLLGR